MNSLQTIFYQVQLPIRQRYSMLVDQIVHLNPVLKTDVWNEINTSWPIQADIYAEIDKNLVKRAIELGLNAIECSITNLLLENNSVFTVIDLSTIDHIQDPYPALKEYFRVLKNDAHSNCYIVCWLGNRTPAKTENWDGMQYYFKEKDFVTKIIKTGFQITYSETFEGLGDNQSYLKFFHLKKTNNFFILPILRYLFYTIGNICKEDDSRLYSKIKTKTFSRVSFDTIASSSMFNIDKAEISPDKNCICLTAINNDPYLILPQIAFPADRMIIKIDITPPQLTNIQIFYLIDENGTYSEKLSVQKSIGPERSHVYMIIQSGVKGRLRIDPGCCALEYLIHKIEIYQYG